LDSDFVNALGALIRTLFQVFGPDRTLYLIFFFVFVLGARRWYNDRQAAKLTNDALSEKERSIQRLAEQEREWRVYFMIKDGMPREDAERLVLRNEFSTPEQARKSLEKPDE
jgi:hypothetical protein